MLGNASLAASISMSDMEDGVVAFHSRQEAQRFALSLQDEREGRDEVSGQLPCVLLLLLLPCLHCACTHRHPCLPASFPWLGRQEGPIGVCHCMLRLCRSAQ